MPDIRAVAFAALLAVALLPCAQAQPAKLSDDDVIEAYLYLLGRLLVLRQQQLDFQDGLKWNELVHRKPGRVDLPNPNLDTADSEAWIAIDESSCVLVNVPRVTGRYYTVQFVSGWGETLTNLNARVYPNWPMGAYAVCLKGAKVRIPPKTWRVELPVKQARMIARVELAADWNHAVVLQKQFTVKSTGNPKLPAVPRVPSFSLDKLPGAEAFDAVEAALAEPDTNPGMKATQAKVRAIAQAVKVPAERSRIESTIRTDALGYFGRITVSQGRQGRFRDGWLQPGALGTYSTDFESRTLANYGAIWANVREESALYRASLDNAGAPLHGDHSYTLSFSKDELPADRATFFWSLTALDAKTSRVLPNRLDRFQLNSRSALQYGKDGSLTLYFAAEQPKGAPPGNWLPTPKGHAYRLTFRYFGPKAGVADRSYFPPPMRKRTER